MKKYSIFFLILFFLQAFCQENQNTLVINTILLHYYKNEKIVYKNRNQLLYLYCNQANNNETIFEDLKDEKLPTEFINQIKKNIKSNTADKNWENELNYIYENYNSKLKNKINSCVSFEKFTEISSDMTQNNRKLLIISKPIYNSKSNAVLVKVVLFRNNEHNSSTILLLEKINSEWVIKKHIDSWST